MAALVSVLLEGGCQCITDWKLEDFTSSLNTGYKGSVSTPTNCSRKEREKPELAGKRVGY